MEVSSRASSRCFIFIYFLVPHWVPATWRSLAQTSIGAELPAGYQIRVYAGDSQSNAPEIAGSPCTVSTDVAGTIKGKKFIHIVTEKIPSQYMYGVAA